MAKAIEEGLEERKAEKEKEPAQKEKSEEQPTRTRARKVKVKVESTHNEGNAEVTDSVEEVAEQNTSVEENEQE